MPQHGPRRKQAMRVSTSFTPAEASALDQLLQAVIAGRDTRIIARNPVVAKLAKRARSASARAVLLDSGKVIPSGVPVAERHARIESAVMQALRSGTRVTTLKPLGDINATAVARALTRLAKRGEVAFDHDSGCRAGKWRVVRKLEAVG